MAKSTKSAYTATTLAAECGADNPKQFRSFLRSEQSGIESVGKGARYSFEFTPTQVGALKKKFIAWAADLAAARADRQAALEDAAAKKLNVLTVAVESEGVEENDEYDDPTGGIGADELPCPAEAEELDFEGLSDDEFNSMIAEVEAEGTDEA